MKPNGFTKLKNEELENKYGGWVWLATAIPIFLQAVMTAVSSYKMLSSDKGSIKYDGADAKWETDHTKTTSHKETTPTRTFYAF